MHHVHTALVQSPQRETDQQGVQVLLAAGARETLPQMKWTQRTMTSMLASCASYRKTMPSRPSLVSSLTWSVSCSHSNPLLPKPCSQDAPTLNPHPELLPVEEQFPGAQASSPSLPPPSWSQAREATPGEPPSGLPVGQPSTVVHTTAPEHHLPTWPQQLPPLPQCRKGLHPSPAYIHDLSGLPPSAWGHCKWHTQHQSSAADFHFQPAPFPSSCLHSW